MSYFMRLQGNDEIGYDAEINGIYTGPKPLDVLKITKTHIVVKSAGYSENPGSRYSGLMAYYPPEITVYEIVERKDATGFRVEALLSWDVGRGKNAPKPKLPPMDEAAL